MSDQWGSVRITIIDVNGPTEALTDAIRAATSRDAAPVLTTRTLSHQPQPSPAARVTQTESRQEIVPSQQLAAPAAQPVAPRKDVKKATAKKKSDSGQRQLKADRIARLEEITKAKTFDDIERYSAAIGKDGASNLDLAALVIRLAQEKFALEEGLSPTEVRTILKNRFYINAGERAMEQAMKEAPSTFFAITPADFDQRAKLYRPMKDCLKRVEELLNEFDHVRLESDDEPRAQAAVN